MKTGGLINHAEILQSLHLDLYSKVTSITDHNFLAPHRWPLKVPLYIALAVVYLAKCILHNLHVFSHIPSA